MDASQIEEQLSIAAERSTLCEAKFRKSRVKFIVAKVYAGEDSPASCTAKAAMIDSVDEYTVALRALAHMLDLWRVDIS